MNFDKFNSLVESRLNYGELNEASVVSDYKNVGCGDAYRLYLVIDRDTIKEASYTTTGCSFSIATLGILCDLVKGKTFEQAVALKHDAFEAYIDGYPERRINYIDTALSALHKAIEDYKNNTGLPKEEVITSLKIQNLLRQQGHLRNALLGKAMLEGFDFSGIDLSYADFQNSFLKKCNFRGAVCKEANFKGAYLNEANLSFADFSGADLRFAKLNGAVIEETNFNDAIYDIGTRFDERHSALLQQMKKRGKDLYVNRSS